MARGRFATALLILSFVAAGCGGSDDGDAVKAAPVGGDTPAPAVTETQATVTSAESPTSVPTEIPTEIPTSVPTETPTPTESPTSIPSPTPTPTETPTSGELDE